MVYLSAQSASLSTTLKYLSRLTLKICPRISYAESMKRTNAQHPRPFGLQPLLDQLNKFRNRYRNEAYIDNRSC